jgi:hypothetical protein
MSNYRHTQEGGGIAMGSPTAAIDLDDLTSPRLTDGQRQVLDYTESRAVTFDIDQMIDEAIASAGSDDLGYTGDFAARLGAHVDAIEADTDLTQLARGTLRSRVVRLLRNRISLADLIRRVFEIPPLNNAAETLIAFVSASMVPSANPARRPSRSRWLRNGGDRRAFESKKPISLSVR